MNDPRESAADRLIRDHRRQWRDCLYVYPVVSRRAGGLSIGVNLNPRKDCTFSCVYCQIDRTVERALREVDLAVLDRELRLALDEAVSGRLWQEGRLADTPASRRRINDIAFSGDGEPTCLEEFDRAVQVAADAKRDAGLDEVKLVLITNASRLDRPRVRRALDILDENNGEVWAKLDAGSEEYFQRVNRPERGLTLDKIVGDLVEVARRRAIVIQSLFARLHGAGPTRKEVADYIGRIRHILDGGGQVKLIQVHTVARGPAEPFVSYLPPDDLDDIARRISDAFEDLRVETFYGADVPPQPRD